MEITIRRARPKDAEICGPICFEAFNAIAGAHNFPPDFPSRALMTVGLYNEPSGAFLPSILY